MKAVLAVSLALLAFLAVLPAGAQEGGGDLAVKLQNPLADLVSVPFQSNFEFGGGPSDEGFRYQLNVQPVAPLGLTSRWNLVTRTIVPFIHQRDLIDDGSQTGLGDVLFSAFLSPKEPGAGGLIWGAGPALSLPLATDSQLGARKWSWGPTLVALKQGGGVTYGVLANHLWSFAGDDQRGAVSATFVQPFLSYSAPSQTSFSLNTEAVRNAMAHERKWTVPVNLTVSQLLEIDGKPMQLSLGYKNYAAGPQGTPDWGFRAVVTMLLPK